jgi:uncharacterized protein (UPF0297 family)
MASPIILTKEQRNEIRLNNIALIIRETIDKPYYERQHIYMNIWEVNNSKVYNEINENVYYLAVRGYDISKLIFILDHPDIFVNENSLADCFDQTKYILDGDGFPIERRNDPRPYTPLRDYTRDELNNLEERLTQSQEDTLREEYDGENLSDSYSDL